jgi:hypothetical protein
MSYVLCLLSQVPPTLRSLMEQIQNSRPMSYVLCLMSSVAGAPEAAVADGADSKFAPIFLREAAHNQVGGGGGDGRWGFGGVRVRVCVCVCVCACVVRGQVLLNSKKKCCADYIRFVILDSIGFQRLISTNAHRETHTTAPTHTHTNTRRNSC